MRPQAGASGCKREHAPASACNWVHAPASGCKREHAPASGCKRVQAGACACKRVHAVGNFAIFGFPLRACLPRIANVRIFASLGFPLRTCLPRIANICSNWSFRYFWFPAADLFTKNSEHFKLVVFSLFLHPPEVPDYQDYR